MKERRREIRVVEENKVGLSLINGGTGPGEAKIYDSLSRDISLGGLRIMTMARLEAGARVEVDIMLGGSRKRIKTVAEVRWVRELYAHEVFEAGLQFVDLEPDAELTLMDHLFRKKGGRVA